MQRLKAFRALTCEASSRWLAACRLGDREAVFQHLKADDFTIGDGEHNGKVRFDNLPGSLQLGRERTKDHCSIVAAQNVEDIEAEPLDHSTRVTNEINDRGPAGFFSDPGQNSSIACYFPLQILAEQLGDLG